MQLFITYENEVYRGLRAFPEYRYIMRDDKAFTKTHTFALPIEPSPNLKYVSSVPLGHVTHIRLSCVMNIDNKAKTIHSKDYTFRIIRNSENTPVFGLNFTRSPSVANVSSDSATIWWETNLLATARFSYSQEGDDEPVIQETADSHRRMSISLSGLKPDTTYEYNVECVESGTGNSLISLPLRFKTAPRKNDFTFVVMSGSNASPLLPNPDSQINGVNVPELNQLALLAWFHDAEFVLFPGNLTRGYTSDINDRHIEYQTWCDTIAPFASKIAFYPSMGERETYPLFSEKGNDEETSQSVHPYPEDIWASTFILPDNGPPADENNPPYSENVYSFNYADCHFVCLNSNYNSHGRTSPEGPEGRIIDARQRMWHEDDLKANCDKSFIFVYFALPAYPTSVYYTKALDKFPKERDALWDILDRYNVDAVFCGSERIYSRFLVDKKVDARWSNSIWQITTGRAGASWSPILQNSPWFDNLITARHDRHLVAVKIQGNKALLEAYDINGHLMDECLMKKKKRKVKDLRASIGGE
jgi:hypothetical protein